MNPFHDPRAATEEKGGEKDLIEREKESVSRKKRSERNSRPRAIERLGEGERWKAAKGETNSK